MVAMASPWKHPKSGIYYLRKGIPEKVRPHFSNKHEIKISLQTKDPRKAKELFVPQLARVEQLISMAEQGGSSLTPKQARALAGMWLQDALEADDLARETVGPPADEKKRKTAHETPYALELEHIPEARSVAEREQWVLHDIEEFLPKSGFVAPKKSSESYALLLENFLAAKHHYYRVINARAQGEWDTVDVSADYPALVAPKVTKVRTKGSGNYLSDILKKYRAEEYISQKSADDYQVSIDEFEKLVGTHSVEQITTSHVREYRDSLMDKSRNLASATVVRKLGAVKTSLSFAMDIGLIDVNPASGIKVRKKDDGIEAKLPYDKEDLRKIFSSPVFTEGYRPRAGGGEAAYWLPYLALYTGARLEELGQLEVNDVQTTEGVAFLEISTQFDAEDSKRSLKSAAGRRIVPLHPKLIKLGFLKYVDDQRKSKHSKLFPQLKPQRYGKLTPNWSKWWNQRYCKEQVGIDEDKKSFHSFRHTFIQGCREARILEDHQNAIVGHKGQGKVSLRYGGWVSPKEGVYPFSPLVLLKSVALVDPV